MAKSSRRTREQIRVVVIPVDGPARSRQIVCDVEVLGDLTGRCGGFEVYPVRVGPTPAWAYVSGEGGIRGQRPNPQASALLGMPIVGPVVIVGGFTPDGDDLSAPDWVLQRLGCE